MFYNAGALKVGLPSELARHAVPVAATYRFEAEQQAAMSDLSRSHTAAMSKVQAEMAVSTLLVEKGREGCTG
jgi:hypothetical protein